MAVVLRTKIEVVTESEIENVTEKILLVGMVLECHEDTESVPGVERGIRNAPGNGKGTEITEIDTAELVCVPLIYTKYFH